MPIEIKSDIIVKIGKSVKRDDNYEKNIDYRGLPK